MFVLSAFADEIDPDPEVQLNVLEGCGVRHIELRSILKTNVLDLSDFQVRELKSLFDRKGFMLSAIASPIGKVPIDQPFAPHKQKFQRAIDLCRVFQTPNIRIFSYYLPAGGSWDEFRQTVLDRMNEKLSLSEAAGLRLIHENEHRIYGDSPERVRDLLATLNHDRFRAAYDPANYVLCGYDPLEGWKQTKDWTVHFHIKDWVLGEDRGRLPGEGNGQIEAVMAEAVAKNYQGFATLEPHLLGGGPTGGSTGPELFPKAVNAFKQILARVGATYQ